MTTLSQTKLSYAEREAFKLVRKVLQRKPELVPALMEGMATDVVVQVLRTAQSELNLLLALTRAMTDVSIAITNETKESK